MQNLIVILFSFLLTISVAAKENEAKTAKDSDNAANVTLSGTVYDSASGELLVGVEVVLEGTDTKTYTDFDGNFSFEDIKPGEYKLVANYISYKESAGVFRLDDNKNQVKIKLKNSD